MYIRKCMCIYVCIYVSVCPLGREGRWQRIGWPLCRLSPPPSRQQKLIVVYSIQQVYVQYLTCVCMYVYVRTVCLHGRRVGWQSRQHSLDNIIDKLFLGLSNYCNKSLPLMSYFSWVMFVPHRVLFAGADFFHNRFSLSRERPSAYKERDEIYCMQSIHRLYGGNYNYCR